MEFVASKPVGVQHMARELHDFARRVRSAPISDLCAMLNRAIESIPPDLDGLDLFIVRSLLVSAVQTALLHRPACGFGSESTQRLCQAASAQGLIGEARRCVAALAEPRTSDLDCHSSDIRVARVLAYIQEQSSRPTLTLDDAAAFARLSRWHLSRLLVRETGLTYREIVLNTRMERARALLADGTLSIKELAAQLGYAYPTEFHRQFKRHFGVSPGQWRHRLRQRAS